MNLKLKYWLDKGYSEKKAKLFEKLTSQINRSKGQTQFLYELCDCDFDKLVKLERKLKNNFLVTPGDKDTADVFMQSRNDRNVLFAEYHSRKTFSLRRRFSRRRSPVAGKK